MDTALTRIILGIILIGHVMETTEVLLHAARTIITTTTTIITTTIATTITVAPLLHQIHTTQTAQVAGRVILGMSK